MRSHMIGSGPGPLLAREPGRLLEMNEILPGSHIRTYVRTDRVQPGRPQWFVLPQQTSTVWGNGRLSEGIEVVGKVTRSRGALLILISTK